jgi:hypothetical protein
MTKTYNPRDVILTFQGVRIHLGNAEIRHQPAPLAPSEGRSWTIAGTFRQVAAPPRRYSGRGEGLIPDSAFHERRGPRHPTSERTYAPDAADGSRRKQEVGCYHKRPVRYDGPEDDEP